MYILYLLTGFLVGMGLSVQTSINGRLRKSVKSPFLTSLISFSVSFLFIALLAYIQTSTLIIPSEFFRYHPVWIWFGGLFGCVFLTGNILLFPKLGAVQTVIFPILGQILAGLCIDEFGLFQAPLSPMTVYKAVGTMLVLGGVMGVVWFAHQKTQPVETQNQNIARHSLWFWRVLGICTGACSTLQITINGQLGLALHSAFHASLISFIVGIISLSLMVAIQRPKLECNMQKAPWWMWTGGFLGALYVLGNAWISPQIGTGSAVVVGLLGLMTAGLIIDHTGMLQSAKKPVSWQQMVCLGAMFAGVCLIRLI